MNEERPDASLLRDSARDADAFGLFYDRHVAGVSRFFVRRTADHATASDLTAETFAQAFASRRRYRNTGQPASAWLYTIATRQLNEFFRKERVSMKYRSRLGIPMTETNDAFDRVDDLDELRQRWPAVRDALGGLTNGSAEAVSLRLGHEWSYEQVAQHLQCSPAAARVRVSRALHLLEQQLESDNK